MENNGKKSFTDSLPPPLRAGAKTIVKGRNFLFENSGFLIVGTITALLWASFEAESYHHFMHAELAPHITFHFIVNDILMVFFFGIAMKEIWEALLPGGALSSPKKAATPLLATAGGVIGPASLFVGLAIWFGAREALRGWAVPCATDIAFSYLVARIVFGKGHPAIPFLLLLAIADDAVGLIILAVFYPQGEMNLPVFFGCVIAAIAFNLFVLKRNKVRNFWPYLIIAGPISWYGFHTGGIHPALALVPIIPTLPHAAKDEGLFSEDHSRDTLNAFEHWWKKPVELILFAFGLANAGVVFSNMEGTTWFVTIGLLVGKPVGIFLFTLLAVKGFKLALPDGMNFRDVLVLGCMAGIGFTVALFVSTVAFPPGSTQDAAKMGALFSFGAAIISVIMAKTLNVGRFTKNRKEPFKLPAPPRPVRETQ